MRRVITSFVCAALLLWLSILNGQMKVFARQHADTKPQGTVGKRQSEPTTDPGKASLAAEATANAAAAAVQRGETVNGVIKAVNVMVEA